MGGIGLRQQRQALELEMLGTQQFNNASYFAVSAESACYNVPQGDEYNAAGELIFTNTLPGITPVCKFDSGNADASWFNVMNSFTYPGTGPDGNCKSDLHCSVPCVQMIDSTCSLPLSCGVRAIYERVDDLRTCDLLHYVL